MLRVVLIDDEALARRGLRRLLASHPGVEVVGEADHAAAAVELIRQARPDAAFLDIGLPEVPGFEILRDLPAPLRVVVVTAHAEHAVRAFDVEAVDYLLKPVSASRLAEAVQRLERACAQPQPEGVEEASPVIQLRTTQRILVTSPDQVVAVRAEGDFSRIIIERLAAQLVLKPLKILEQELPTPPFLRLGRSLIVNIRRLQEIQYQGRGQARIALQGCADPLLLGPAATARLRAWTAGVR